MYQIQIPIGNLPVNLILLSDGTLCWINTGVSGIMFDIPETGIKATFYHDSFEIGGEDFHYNTIYHYKQIPNMLQWLKQQNLVEPVVVFA